MLWWQGLTLPRRWMFCSHCGYTLCSTCKKMKSKFGKKLLLYAFFWVIPWRLNFIWRRFVTLCSIFIGRQVQRTLCTCLPMKMEQSVPKRWHIKFRRWGITQKKAYNIQNTAKVWNREETAASLELRKWMKVSQVESKITEQLQQVQRRSLANNMKSIQQILRVRGTGGDYCFSV